MSFARCIKSPAGAVFVLTIVVGLVCPSASAEWVWNPKAGTFLRGNAEIKDTDTQQVEYIHELLEQKDLESASAATVYLKKFFPGSRKIPEALFTVAKALEEVKEYNKAFKMYQEILDDHPNNNYTNQILLHQFDIGVKFLEGARYRLMGVPTVPMLSKAEHIFSTIKKSSPYHEYGEKSQYYLGLTYEKMKQYENALDAYETLLDEYPTTEFAADASFRVGEIMYKMAQQSYETESAAREAHKKFDEFIGKYPNSISSVDQAREYKQKLLQKEASQIYKTARYYEKLRRLESAQIYYTEVVEMAAGTKWAKKAARRLKMFENPEEALAQGEQALQEELSAVKEQLAALRAREESLSEEDFTREEKEIVQKTKELRKELKGYDKRKSEELALRWAVLDRKEKEFKAREKNIAKKKALLKEQPSEDLEIAIGRWDASLRDEHFRLKQEREELERVSERLGYHYGLSIPFLVSSIESVDVGKLAAYKEEQIAALKNLAEENSRVIVDLRAAAQTMKNVIEGKAGAIEAEEVRRTRALAQKEELKKEKRANDPLWKRAASVPVDLITYPSDLALSLVQQNDFDKKQKIERELTLVSERLARVEQEIKDARRLIAQENKRARDENEQVVDDDDPAKMSDRELRRRIKRFEKEINEQYRVISDSEDRTYALSEEILSYVENRKKTRGGVGARIGRALLSPGVSVVHGVKIFLFGIESKEVQAEETAARELEREEGSHADRIQELRNSIALEKQKSAAARMRAQKLFLQLSQLRSHERGGFFSSLLVSPLSFFSDDGNDEKDIDFLERLIVEQKKKREKFSEKKELLSAELETISKKIDVSERPSDTETEGSEISSDEKIHTRVEPHMSKRQIKREKKVFAVKKSEFEDTLNRMSDAINDQQRFLEDAEMLLRKRIERISDVVEKYKGSSSEKYADIVLLRKTSFGTLDRLVSAQQELDTYRDEVNNMKGCVMREGL